MQSGQARGVCIFRASCSSALRAERGEAGTARRRPRDASHHRLRSGGRCNQGHDMNETPRADVALWITASKEEVVFASFARELERELIKVRRQAAALREALEKTNQWIDSHVGMTSGDHE